MCGGGADGAGQWRAVSGGQGGAAGGGEASRRQQSRPPSGELCACTLLLGNVGLFTLCKTGISTNFCKFKSVGQHRDDSLIAFRSSRQFLLQIFFSPVVAH